MMIYKILYPPLTKTLLAVAFLLSCATHAAFISGTKVLADSGFVGIEEVGVGQKVLGYKANVQSPHEYVVGEKFLYTPKTLVRIAVGGTLLYATETQQFLSSGHEWKRAGNLTADDQLMALDRQFYPVDSVAAVANDKKQFAHTFEVEDAHTYYVAKLGIVAHNPNTPGGACGGIEDNPLCSGRKREPSGATQRAREEANRRIRDADFFQQLQEFQGVGPQHARRRAVAVVAVDKSNLQRYVPAVTIRPEEFNPEDVATPLRERVDFSGLRLGEPGECKNIVGRCAEFRAYDALLKQGSDWEDIRISQPARPGKLKQVLEGQATPNDFYVAACANCKKLFRVSSRGTPVPTPVTESPLRLGMLLESGSEWGTTGDAESLVRLTPVAMLSPKVAEEQGIKTVGILAQYPAGGGQACRRRR